MADQSLIDYQQDTRVTPSQTGKDNELNDSESVASRYTGLLQGNSPIIQQARTSGLQQAQARGLMNSSIAVGAAEDAAARAALPIAQQDAALSGQYGMANKNFGYTQSLSAQGFKQTGLLQSAEDKARSELSKQEAGQSLTAQTQAESAARERQVADIQAQFGLSKQEAEQRLAAQESSQGFQKELSAQGAAQQLTAQTQAEKAARDRQIEELAAQEKITRFEAEQKLIQQDRDIANQQFLQKAGAEAAKDLTNLQGSIQQANMIAEYAQRGQLSAAQAQQQADLLAKEYGLKGGLSIQETANQLALAQDAFTKNVALANLNSQSAMNLAVLETQNRLLLQSNDSAAQIYNGLTSQISSIMANESMDANTKTSNINSLISYYNNYFTLQQSLMQASGFDVTKPQQLGPIQGATLGGGSPVSAGGQQAAIGGSEAQQQTGAGNPTEAQLAGTSNAQTPPPPATTTAASNPTTVSGSPYITGGEQTGLLNSGKNEIVGGKELPK